MKTKPEIFNKFTVWLNLPTQFLKQPLRDIKKSGITDPIYLELISIRTRAEFSRKYKVSQKTLVFWSKEVSTTESDSHMYQFFQKYTKELLLSFYEQQLIKPTPKGLLVWYEIIKGWHKEVLQGQGLIENVLDDKEKTRIRKVLHNYQRRVL